MEKSEISRVSSHSRYLGKLALFLLYSVEGSAKSCLANSGSDRYEVAWTALEESFGRVDTVVSAAKKSIDQFPENLENRTQI